MEPETDKNLGLTEFKFCHGCGKKLHKSALVCQSCSAPQPDIAAPSNLKEPAENEKNKLVAALLALILGGIGAHHFYMGHLIMGVIYLLFCWTFIPAILGLIEGLLLLFMSEKKFQSGWVAKKYRATT